VDQVESVVSKVLRVVETASIVWQPESKELLEMLRMLQKLSEDGERSEVLCEAAAKVYVRMLVVATKERKEAVDICVS